MEMYKKTKPIPIKGKMNKILINIKDKSNCFNLLGDNIFFPKNPPKKDDSNFSKLLTYNISPSSFKKYSLNEYYLKSL
jgi:hypothetical protein